jgi:hypothetical protein
MSALHEAAELIAAEGVSDVIVFYSVTARARPGGAEGGE